MEILMGYKCRGAGNAINYNWSNGLLVYRLMKNNWKKQQKKVAKENVYSCVEKLLSI